MRSPSPRLSNRWTDPTFGELPSETSDSKTISEGRGRLGAHGRWWLVLVCALAIALIPGVAFAAAPAPDAPPVTPDAPPAATPPAKTTPKATTPRPASPTRRSPTPLRSSPAPSRSTTPPAPAKKPTNRFTLPVKPKPPALPLIAGQGTPASRTTPAVEPSGGLSNKMLLIFVGTVAGVALASIAATRLAMNRAAAARAANAPEPYEFPITQAYPAEPLPLAPTPIHSQARRPRVPVDDDESVVPLETARTARQPR